MASIPKEVGTRFRILRMQKEHTQESMSVELDITPGAYAKIERGETDPSISRLFEIAAILKVDIVSLVKNPDEAISDDVKKQISALTKDVEALKKQMASQSKPSSKKK